MQAHGVCVDLTTVFRLVQRDAPELEQRWQPQLNTTSDSYRVDETYIQIKNMAITSWAVNSVGATLDFMLNAT